MRELESEFQVLQDVGDALHDCEILALNTGYNGTCYVLARKTSATDAPIDDPYLTRSNQLVRVLEVSEHGVGVFDLPGVNPYLSFVQPLPGQRFLVGWSRTGVSRGRKEHEDNALVVSDQGEKLASFTIGDAVEDVQATQDGTIWVSYFDEGMTGPPRNGSGRSGWLSGLVNWSLDGQILYEYPPGMMDCYAINLENDNSLWACYYTGFPLVNIARDHVERCYPATVCGAKVLAVSRRGVLFGRGYGVAGEDRSPPTSQVRVLTTGDGAGRFHGRESGADYSDDEPAVNEPLANWSQIWSLYRFDGDALQLVERFRLPRNEDANELYAARGPFVFWLRDGVMRRLCMERLFGTF